MFGKSKNEKIKGSDWEATDVASYMLHAIWDLGDSVTNIKLQKLLFFAQAEYLVRTGGKRLFRDDLILSEDKLIVRSVYDKYRCCGLMPISPQPESDGDTPLHTLRDLWNKGEDCTPGSVIAIVLQKYLPYSGLDLNAMIYNVIGPRIDSWQRGRESIISTNELRERYEAATQEAEEIINRIEKRIEIQRQMEKGQDDSQSHIAEHSLNG